MTANERAAALAKKYLNGYFSYCVNEFIERRFCHGYGKAILFFAGRPLCELVFQDGICMHATLTEWQSLPAYDADKSEAMREGKEKFNAEKKS